MKDMQRIRGSLDSFEEKENSKCNNNECSKLRGIEKIG